MAVAPGEAPDAVVVLKRGLRAEHHSADAAELSGSGKVELGDRERLLEKAVADYALEAKVRAARGIRVRALARKLPVLLEETRMVDVEVIVDIVVVAADELVGDL